MIPDTSHSGVFDVMFIHSIITRCYITCPLRTPTNFDSYLFDNALNTSPLILSLSTQLTDTIVKNLHSVFFSFPQKPCKCHHVTRPWRWDPFTWRPRGEPIRTYFKVSERLCRELRNHLKVNIWRTYISVLRFYFINFHFSIHIIILGTSNIIVFKFK